MRGVLIGMGAAAMLVLAGCQSSGSNPPPVVQAPGGGPATTGDKVTVCTSQAASKFGVGGDALSLSNDYPTTEGDAIDGAATLADGFKRFRCDFTREGAFVSITELTADQ